MNEKREPTPTSDASVVGASPPDFASTVSTFFARFPFDGASESVDKLPASRFFDAVFGETDG